VCHAWGVCGGPGGYSGSGLNDPVSCEYKPVFVVDSANEDKYLIFNIDKKIN
jgi:hypothetical protein